MFLTSKKLPKHVWKGDGVLPPDFISPSSETPGELREYKNAQHERAMKSPVKNLDEELRKKGLI
jgi:hypothetical protein